MCSSAPGACPSNSHSLPHAQLHLTFSCLTFSFQHLDSSYIFLQLDFEHLVFSAGIRMFKKKTNLKTDTFHPKQGRDLCEEKTQLCLISANVLSCTTALKMTGHTSGTFFWECWWRPTGPCAYRLGMQAYAMWTHQPARCHSGSGPW